MTFRYPAVRIESSIVAWRRGNVVGLDQRG